jgi:hypothetical protein
MAANTRTRRAVRPSPRGWCLCIAVSGQLLTHAFAVEHGGFGSVSGKVDVKLKFNHEGEVNRYAVDPPRGDDSAV